MFKDSLKKNRGNIIRKESSMECLVRQWTLNSIDLSLKYVFSNVIFKGFWPWGAVPRAILGSAEGVGVFLNL
jgi:hypothetical protein